jgi:acetyl esterase/lipase
MKRLAILIALGLVLGALPFSAQAKRGPKEPKPPKPSKIKCHDDEDATSDLTVTVEGQPATGKYALPDTDPKTLVVFAHGYSHKSDSWIDHMRKAAGHGVIAVTMDYRGTYTDPEGNIRGWFVKEGAADMIAATHLFQNACSSIEKTVLFSVSMGGNAAGLALAQAKDEKNATGGPLFDYWFNVEGAVNVIETYAGASVLAPANAFAANAKADIEDEMNGSIADDPQGYADLAVVSHLEDIAASGLTGAVVIHALEDGLVPYNQAREIIPELVAGGIATEVYTIAGKGDGEGGTTISGYSGDDSSPFAGHASEASDTHIVMVTAFDRLWQLLDEGTEVFVYDEIFVPGV